MKGGLNNPPNILANVPFFTASQASMKGGLNNPPNRVPPWRRVALPTRFNEGGVE